MVKDLEGLLAQRDTRGLYNKTYGIVNTTLKYHSYNDSVVDGCITLTIMTPIYASGVVIYDISTVNCYARICSVKITTPMA